MKEIFEKFLRASSKIWVNVAYRLSPIIPPIKTAFRKVPSKNEYIKRYGQYGEDVHFYENKARNHAIGACCVLLLLILLFTTPLLKSC
jgi:hypothetical protein